MPDLHARAAHADRPVETGNPSTRLFESAVVEVGRFWCSPRHPEFRTVGPITGLTFVFPATGVWIEHEGEPPFLGNPARVVLYNDGQRYERRACDPAGDRCTWFVVADPVAREIVGTYDPRAADSPRVLRFSHAPARAQSYYRHKLIARPLHRASSIDPLYVEEAVITLFGDVVAAAYEARDGAASCREPAAHHRAIVEDVAAELYRTCTANHSLAAIARGAGVSMFHLCRLFRRLTGMTMHAYRHRLRLTRALDALGHPDVDLLALAIDLGYCSHSHFTTVFRQQLGMVPSEARHRLAAAAAR